MMKRVNLVIPILLFLVIMCSKDTVSVADNPAVPAEKKVYVDITVKAVTTKLAPASKGEVIISLVPRTGVKLNKIPPLQIQIEPSEILQFEKKELLLPPEKELKKLEDKYFETMMDPDADMSQFYFPPLKPFSFPFTIVKEPPSNFRINLKLVYTYCTIKDGFCAPREKSLKIPLTLKQPMDGPKKSE